MEVKEKSTFSRIASTALTGGLVATACERLLLPAEAKAALKNTRGGQDAFLKKAHVAAVKTMKNTGKVFDMNVIAENAKKMYPDMLKTAKKASASLLNTFTGVATALFVGLSISQIIRSMQQNKE